MEAFPSSKRCAKRTTATIRDRIKTKGIYAY